MGIKIKLDGEEMTDILSLSIRLDFKSGLETHLPMAPQISFTRKVGIEDGSDTDLKTFEVLQGGNEKAGIVPVETVIELTDDNEEDSAVGEFTFEESFVESYGCADEGLYVIEDTVLRGNKVTYSRNDGEETEVLDVTQLQTEDE